MTLRACLEGVIDTSVPRPFAFPEPTKALATPISVVAAGQSSSRRRAADDDEDEAMRTLSALERSLAAAQADEMLRKSALSAGGAAERQPLTRVPLDPRWERARARRLARAQGPQTAGKRWYDLPATPLTPEVLAHLKLQHMRALLDPARTWARQRRRRFVPPKFFELGTVVPGPADRYTAPPKRTRGRTLVEAVLADSELRRSVRGRFASMVLAKHDHRKRKLFLLRKKMRSSRR